MHFVSGLLAAERRRRGTRLAQLAADHRIGSSTAYRYLHEGIDVLAAAAPGLRRGAAGCPSRRPFACDGGRHASPHRPVSRRRPDGPRRSARAPGGGLW